MPDLFDDGGARDGLAGLAHEEFQEGELLGAEIDGLSATAHRVRNAVQLEIIDFQHESGGAIATPQNSANTGAELGKDERLRDIVVGAGVEAADTIFDRT